MFSALNIHSGNDNTATAAINTTAVNNNVVNINDNNNPAEQKPPCVVREQDQFMPIANVVRTMRRALPPHAKISDDAKETVQECVSEFIGFLTGEANERCHNELRKTITAEDVIWSLKKLGFDNYVGPLTLYMKRYRQNENQRNSAPKEPNVGPQVAEYRQIGMPGVNEPVPVYDNMVPGQSFFDPYSGLYYGDSSGSSSGGGLNSQNNMPDSDPSAHFN